LPSDDIRLIGLVKRYADVVAVGGIDLGVRQGESSRCSARPALARGRRGG
jgi:hypothetical protein